MSEYRIDEDAIRRRVEKRIKAQREFISHFITYCIVNALIWCVWAFAPAIMNQIGLNTSTFPFSLVALPWPLLVMFGWGIGLVGHGMNTYYKSDTAEKAKERMVQREIEKERMRLYGNPDLEKPKRRRARLSDDGEITYEDPEEAPVIQSKRLK